MPLHHARRAAAARDLARKAIRLANSQTSEPEKLQLTRYAEELDAKAIAIERSGEEGGKLTVRGNRWGSGRERR